jgi:hypothetical protein
MNVQQVFTWTVDNGQSYSIVASDAGESSAKLQELLKGQSFRARCPSNGGYLLQVS